MTQVSVLIESVHQMGKKAEQKREYILEQAKKVFSQKGYKNVTMKDIVSACNISRGGVYLHFHDTKELFEAVLQREEKSGQSTSIEPIHTAGSAKEEMRQFLHMQKHELLNPSDSLIIATCEYLFAQRSTIDRSDLEKKFLLSVEQLSAILQRGVAEGAFSVEPRVAASNIVLLLEGVRISSTVLAFDEDFLDRQMEYVLSMLEGGKEK